MKKIVFALILTLSFVLLLTSCDKYVSKYDENYVYDKGVLLHEMLHIYFYQTGNTFERHGENFISEAKKLEKLTGYPIHIIYPNTLSQ